MLKEPLPCIQIDLESPWFTQLAFSNEQEVNVLIRCAESATRGRLNNEASAADPR